MSPAYLTGLVLTRLQLLNLGLKEQYQEGINKLGFSIEDLLDQERDAALGNGGLGRLAACYLDSSASQVCAAGPSRRVQRHDLFHLLGIARLGIRLAIPIRYFPAGKLIPRRFRPIIDALLQLISPEGNQLEAPDPWLANQNPWEVTLSYLIITLPVIEIALQLPRLDVSYEIRFYGNADRLNDGTPRASWTGGQEVLAIAYDVMIPGCYTKTTNNLRLWESKPKRGFDLNSFNGTARSLSIRHDVNGPAYSG